jgi:hypothetical protein
MSSNGKMNISALESWLWEAACVIRGPVDAPKFEEVRRTVLDNLFKSLLHHLMTGKVRVESLARS